MHIGSGSGRLFTVGIQVKPLVPFLTSTNLPSSPGIMIAASLEISGGAALSASLIIASLDIPLTPLPFILCPSSANERVERLRAKPTNQIVLRTRFMVPSLDNWIRCECEPRRVRSIDTAPFASELGVCPSIGVLEPVQGWPDARRKEGLRAERTESYVSTQGRLTTQQMAIHGQAPSPTPSPPLTPYSLGPIVRQTWLPRGAHGPT